MSQSESESRPGAATAAPVANSAGESLVNVCGALDCRYNRDRACTAGAISIAVVSGRPVCATYSPADPERTADGATSKH